MGELYSCLPLRGQTDRGVVFLSSPCHSKLIGELYSVFPSMAKLMGELYSCLPLRDQTDGGCCIHVFPCMAKLMGELYSCLPLRGQTDGGVVFLSSPVWPD